MSVIPAGALRDFTRDFDTVTGRHNRGQVWRDWIWLCATSIANSLPSAQRAAREQRYQEIMRQYEPENQVTLARLLNQLVEVMDAGVSAGEFGDFLGEMFMRLELSSSMNGQFFTPYHLCRLMAQMTVDGPAKEIQQKGWTSLNEPACGAGATLIAMAEALHCRGINYQNTVFFTAQDLDSTCALMCYIQLSLLGCAGWVRIGDTLSHPPTAPMLLGADDGDTWYTPMYYSKEWSPRILTARLTAVRPGRR